MINRSVVALWFLALSSPVLAAAPVWQGSQGWGQGSAYNRLFDPATVVEVSGVVISVDTFIPSAGMSSGIVVQLQTDAGQQLAVHLGPLWYLANQDLRISPNDRLTVKGSRVVFEGKPALIASEVRKAGGLLILRDARGVPAWSGMRGGSGG